MPEDRDICPACEGLGVIEMVADLRHQPQGRRRRQDEVGCAVCRGDGLVPADVAGCSFKARIWRWKLDAFYAGGLGHPHYVRAESGRYGVVDSHNGWAVAERAIAEGAVHVALFTPGRKPELLAEWREGKRVN